MEVCLPFFAPHSRVDLVAGRGGDLVPVDQAPVRGCCLRLEPARNNQQAGIRWAVDYLIGPP